jgi:NAD(P)-dependent dehydrogenase (short-subunit alcohol dehydrogenase family)
VARRVKSPARRALAGRVALVTGAGSRRGIGRATALVLAGQGARVAALDVDARLVAETAARISRRGGASLALTADVASAREVEAAVAATVERFGRLDILVNNAGIVRLSPFLRLDEATWDRTLDVNVKGVYLCSQAAARQMVRQGKGGVIVNVSSTSALVPTPALAHYSASKAAVSSLTRSLAAELGGYGIRVAAVEPGTIATDILGHMPADAAAERRQRMLPFTPIGRLGEPEDVARVIAFLASDQASFVTGSTILVDGAQVAGGWRPAEAWRGTPQAGPGPPGARRGASPR